MERGNHNPQHTLHLKETGGELRELTLTLYTPSSHDWREQQKSLETGIRVMEIVWKLYGKLKKSGRKRKKVSGRVIAALTFGILHNKSILET